jgi:hypothetical protein
VERIAIVATLKPDAYERAQELLKEGPPFDLDTGTFARHAVYLSHQEVMFVFEGVEVEWRLDDLVSDFTQWKLKEAFSEWQQLIVGSPRIARQAFYSEASEEGPA